MQLTLAHEHLESHAKALADCAAHEALADVRDLWQATLPQEAAALFDWCVEQPQEVLLDLLAFCAAGSINAVHAKYQNENSPCMRHADSLAAVLGLDMASWWTPSVEGFYGRLPKATLLHIVREAKAPMSVSIGQVKKHEAARYVAQAMQERAWLPAPLQNKELAA